MVNPWLIVGAGLSAIAALLHLAIIVGGPAWYRWFGAGKRIVALAEQGDPRAGLITLAIGAVLALWSAYALSGAGLLPRLPLLREGLVAITMIYLARGLALLPLLVWAPARATPFIVGSSVIVTLYGLIYAAGTVTAWPRL
jgi:hypothetical protein